MKFGKMIRQGIQNKSDEMIEHHFLINRMDRKQKNGGT